MTDWIKACSIDNLGQGEMFSFDHNEKKLLLTNMNGKIFATDRICTHAEADLSTGILTENGLTCPLHLSVFNICLLYTSPSPRDGLLSRMPSSA